MFRPTQIMTQALVGLVIGAQGSGAAASPPCMTEGVPSAFELYQGGQFEQAVGGLVSLARGGDPRAQLYLATLYRTGSGVAEDEYEAAYWYRRAARQGVAEAQFHLGVMYLQGVGLTENSNAGLEWISRAARQGFGDAEEVFSYLLTHDEALAC